MKKIYITTFQNANNYGAALQALALQQALDCRYSTKILNYDNSTISNEYRCFKKRHGIKARSIQLAKDILSFTVERQRNHNFTKFRREYFHETALFKTASDIARSYPKGDAYITGSDQVWNPVHTNGLDTIYTLNFGHGDFKKISYAASSGNNEVIKNDLNELAQYLQDFDAISVREESLRRLLLTKGFNKIQVTLDPTLLLTKSEWDKIISDERIEKQKYIVAYSWNESRDFLHIINHFAKKNHYKIYYFHRHDLRFAFHGKRASYYTYGPQDFLNLIKNAEYVFTNSFHGTAFSIIFNKPFFVTPTKYFDRIETLLETTGLTNRIISNQSDFNCVEGQSIDWKKVNNSIMNKRAESLSWLYDAIEKD